MTSEVLTDAEGIGRLAPEWLALWARQERPLADQRPDWLLTRAGWEHCELCVGALRSGNELVAVAPFLVPVRDGRRGRAVIPRSACPPIIVERSADLAAALLEPTLGSLAGYDRVQVGYIEQGTPVCEAVLRSRRLRAHWSPCRLTPWTYRWRIRVDGDFDAYLQARWGKQSLRKLRQEVRRLESEMVGVLDLRIVARPEETSDLHTWVSKVLERSWRARFGYDWTLWTAGRRQRAEWQAERGLLRAYVLLGRGEPIAFVVGSLAEGCFLVEKVGYDADWERRAPGKVLWHYILQDLHREPEARWVDFEHQDWEYKRRLATEGALEANVILVRRRLPALARSAPFVARHALRRELLQAANRWGLRARLQRSLERSPHAAWLQPLKRWLSPS